MNRKFTIGLKRYLINRVIDETAAGQLSRHNFVQKLWSEKLKVMGIDIPDERVTLFEKQLAQVFSFRLNESVNLAIKLKLIKSQQYSFSTAREEHLTSMFVTTRAGRFFRRMPSFLQTVLLFIATSAQRLGGTVKRFKWLAGVISFATLSFKVWQSGLIDKAWIGISALVGLAVVFLLSLWGER